MQFCELKRDLNSNFYFSNLCSTQENTLKVPPFAAQHQELTRQPNKPPTTNVQEPLERFVFSSFGPQFDSSKESMEIKNRLVLIDDQVMVEKVDLKVFDGHSNDSVTLDVNEPIDKQISTLFNDEMEIDQEIDSNDMVLKLNQELIQDLITNNNPDTLDQLQQNLVTLLRNGGNILTKEEIKELLTMIPQYDQIYYGTL